MKRTRLIIIFLGIILGSAVNAFACGPDFDDAYFVRMPPDEFYAIPEGHFLFELRRISGIKDVYQLATEPVKHVIDADIDDLKTAKNYVSAALDAAMNGQPVAVNTTKSYGCSVKY